MKRHRLEAYFKNLMHNLAEINQEIFSSGDYREFISLCNNDSSIIALLDELPVRLQCRLV